VKQGGVPLHRLAREGREVERAPKRVRIDRLELLDWAPPLIEIEVACSAGTYVRALAADLGEALGCGAHLASLRRTYSEPFESAQALTVETLEKLAEEGGIEDCIIPPAVALGCPVLRLDPDATRRVLHGAEITAGSASFSTLANGSRVTALEPGGEMVAVLEMRPGRRLHPPRVLRSVAAPG
jgi:tRNA pseudouridine55 synthase